jgi:single-strand DNA-binding protein
LAINKKENIMGRCVNKVFLLGHVGKDPEIHPLRKGIVVILSLATSDRFIGNRGETRVETEWHNLVAYQRTAEIIRDFVRKGSRLFVEGKMRTRFWDDDDTGQKRSRTEIIVLQLNLLSYAADSNAVNGSVHHQPDGDPEGYPHYARLPEITHDLVPY